MIKVSPGTEPSAKLVKKIIKKFQMEELPRLQKLEQYYQVKNDILGRQLSSEKPNNRIAHGFAKYITNMATGFFMGEGLRIDTEDTEYKKELEEALGDHANETNFEVTKEMSKKGISFELLYMNEHSEIRSRYFKAEDFIPVYSTSVSEFLEFAIRVWQETDLLTGKTISCAAVYTRTEIITYRQKLDKKYEEVGRELHKFPDVPVMIYWNNEEVKGDYEDVLTKIDAYDKAQSDTANDFEYFTNAYLVIAGAAGGLEKVGEYEDEEGRKAAKTLRQERILFVDEKGQAQWLVKQVNDTAVENFKNRIYDDIFFLSLVPALTDESFAGNLTGVAIRYKLIGLEQLAAIKEYKFLPAYKKKLRLITKMINLKKNRNYDASTVKVYFDRNMTDNLKELAEIAALLEGIISKETQLSLLPFIKDKQEELQRVLADRLKKMDYDNLGNLDPDKVANYVTGG
ncbi:phage portal protein [Metasolibacillus meyeri]|uniref:Phage portal protein n=1 Tax=Metasolibacillus meyeri TaxID=1071052 RepID=A0AAW9NS68_9BACL|nr:phage portal protein [Metasolibacillus meyeri]MEC1178529.1 phage portal protein [Metasolibacillus meyeri]